MSPTPGSEIGTDVVSSPPMRLKAFGDARSNWWRRRPRSDFPSKTSSMADVFSKQQRSQIMGRIGPRDTQPEKAVRSFLHRRGFRYSLHRRDLPGSPDIVLARHRAVVFVNGCFWHGHRGCSRASLPKTRRGFWTRKIQGNIHRDELAVRALRRAGWRVFTIWQCHIKNERRLETLLNGLSHQ